LSYEAIFKISIDQTPIIQSTSRQERNQEEMTDFGRSGTARGPGSFSRGRGGAGANRDGGYSRPNEGASDSYVGRNPSFSQQQQGFQTSQSIPQHQGFQTSQSIPQHQGFQTSQGYNSSGQQPAFDRSRSGMGSFSRGQGSQGGYATSRQGGGVQDRAVHPMGQQVLSGGPDSNEDWRKKQEEAVARNANIIVQETPAKKLPVAKEVVVIGDHEVQHVGGLAIPEHTRVEIIPVEPIIRHQREQVTPPSSLSRPIAQSVPVPSGAAVSGLISTVTGASSKGDMEQISEIVGLLAEAFHKLDIFVKSKK